MASEDWQVRRLRDRRCQSQCSILPGGHGGLRRRELILLAMQMPNVNTMPMHTKPCILSHKISDRAEFPLTSTHCFHEQLAHALEKGPKVPVVIHKVDLTLQRVSIDLGPGMKHFVVATGRS